MGKHLLVLSCSQVKRDCAGLLPAIDRYDGPAYRILKKHLREFQWPANISIAVLSAKYGLFGSLKDIENYDLKMSPRLAKEQASQCSATLRKWAENHESIHLALGKDYLPAIQPALNSIGSKKRLNLFGGPIGRKLNQIKTLIGNCTSQSRVKPPLVEGGTGRMSYYLPDWDDLLDPYFDFEQDRFSESRKQARSDRHCCVLMKPERMCDGILVSLAQNMTSRGPLRRMAWTESRALSPIPLRDQFGLSDEKLDPQYLFGDCGAFSYVNEDEPTISVEQAVALYELYNFDYGASVDHIPVKEIHKEGARTPLSDADRRKRVEITRLNAERFIEATKTRNAGFNPVGTIQALSPEQYAQSVQEYWDLGYRHMAIGGLVPLKDSEIESIVKAVMGVACQLKERPWIHLFGVYRPNLQALFRQLKVDSFDSATYFRKAWLRSSQNYLSTNGKWYAALRVPMTTDPRTRKRMIAANADIDQLVVEERRVLEMLCLYDKHQVNTNEVLDALLSYDQHLTRSSETHSMRAQYRRTLEDRPWLMCKCPFCVDVGIHILIFRGSNRNKRRGAHNTLMLYGSMQEHEDV